MIDNLDTAYEINDFFEGKQRKTEPSLACKHALNGTTDSIRCRAVGRFALWSHRFERQSNSERNVVQLIP